MILDTNALSSFIAGPREMNRAVRSARSLELPVVVLGEYLYGLEGSTKRERLRKHLDQILSQAVVLPIDERTAMNYSQIRHELRVKGKPIPANDVWIAALATAQPSDPQPGRAL